jgi:hypothetical protein
MAISISEVIAQNTVGGSDGKPAGVPEGWGFYEGVQGAGAAPPSDFTAVTGWAHMYQEAGAPEYTNTNASIEVANSKTYVRLKATGEWILVQDQASTGITGGLFVTDFSGPTLDMRVGAGSSGSTAVGAPPAGYMDHVWPTARGTFEAGAVDAVYVQMDMRTTDPNLHLIAQLGADWWRDANAPFYSDFRNNPGVGTNNWVELTTEWKTMGYYSTTTAEFQANPPPLVGSGPTTPPVTGTPDTTAPAAPKIVAFTPDTGSVGDKITTASDLTLSGTAEAGSTVKLFDGTTQIGTATANASGSWSVATSELSGGTHNFTATATDAAGNTSSASSALSLRVDTTSSPPVTSPPVTSPPSTGANLLVNGSFEASPVAAGRWEGFSSIPGWTALTGGTIELWNNLNNVEATDGSNFGEIDYMTGRDGFYQNVKTTAGQSYDLSFDARSRPDWAGLNPSIEILWNDRVVASVPSESVWQTHHFSVTGTGGQDRLTFREAAGSGPTDGHGALYDNVSLVAAGTASAVQPAAQQSAVTQQPSAVTEQPSAVVQQPSAVTQQPSLVSQQPGGAFFNQQLSAISQRAMDLMNQYAATGLGDRGAGLPGQLRQTDLSASLAQTLGARSH